MQNKVNAEEVIKKLGLSPLAKEGGWFKRTWESQVRMTTEERDGQRSASAIYYLITPEQFSAFHKINSDEIFHFYYGDPVEIHSISPEGINETNYLGTDLFKQQKPQQIIAAKHWQALRCYEKNFGFSLMGCTVSPEFIWEDFEIGKREELRHSFPHLSEIIDNFTRES